MNVAAVRNLAVVALLMGGYIYFAVSNRAAPRPAPRTMPLSIPVVEGYPVDSPPPQVARCPSCSIPVPVAEHTRRAVHDGKVYYFLNDTCEAQWRASHPTTQTMEDSK